MQNIDISLRSSRIFLIVLLVLLFTSEWIIMTLPIAYLIKGLLMIIAAIYVICIIYKHCLLKSVHSVQKIRQLTGGATWLITTPKKQVRGSLSGETIITRWMVILRFICVDPYRKQSVLIFLDALNQAEYRQLLLQLRCYTS
jgi:hypothetical protein